jgi:hypothetical protein
MSARALKLAHALTRLAGAHHGGCLLPLILVALMVWPVKAAIRGASLAGWTAALALGLGFFFIALSPLMSSPQFSLGTEEAPRWDRVLLTYAWALALFSLLGLALTALLFLAQR